MTLSNMVRKFIPMPKAMKIPDAKAAADKEWNKLETIPARIFWKSQEQKGGTIRAKIITELRGADFYFFE